MTNEDKTKKEPEREAFQLSALGSKLLPWRGLRLFAAGGHRRAAAIFTLQVNDRQTLRSPDDSRGQHPAPRTNHSYCCIGSSCHAIAPNAFRRRSAPNGSLHTLVYRPCVHFDSRVSGNESVFMRKLSIFPIHPKDMQDTPQGVTRPLSYISGYDDEAADISVGRRSTLKGDLGPFSTCLLLASYKETRL